MTDRELKERMRQALDRSMPPLPDDPHLTGKILGRHTEKHQKKRARMNGLRVAAVAAVIVLVIFGEAIMLVFSYSYVDARQSEDGEQYVLRGVRVTPPIIQSAEAELPYVWLELTTADFDEAVEALGTVPLVPVWLPDGWDIELYYVLGSRSRRQLSMLLGQSPDGETASNRMVYSTTTFSDIEEFYIAIEANGEGKYVELENGLSIYVDMNLSRVTSMWREGATVYSLSGNITEEELLHIIRSMYGLD